MKTLHGFRAPLFALLLASCLAPSEPRAVDIAAAQQALGVTGGDIPLPAKVVNGALKPSWNGTYSELLAADALAACWTTQAERAAIGGTSDPDQLNAWLATRMGEAACKSTCTADPSLTGADVLFCAWKESRQDRNCNLDAGTGLNKALDWGTLRSSSETLAYKLPPASGTNSLGLTGTAATTVRNRAQEELSYTDLTLCMAQQLRQHLDSVQIAFASGSELARLQEMVRERALSAVFQYSALSKAFATSQVTVTAINDASYYALPLTIWSRLTLQSASNWERMGQDFSSAVQLLVQSTDAVAELKLRTPDAQRSFGREGGPVGFSTIGMIGPRPRLLNEVLYDVPSAFRRAVDVDMSQAENTILLGIARRADALRLTFSAGTFDRNANASTLHLAAENRLRNDDCTARAITPCPLAVAGTSLDDYVLWQRYGITRADAKTLVSALAHALFGPPTADTAEFALWSYRSPNLFRAMPIDAGIGPAQVLPFHVLGNHRVLQPNGTPFAIDPNAAAGTTATVVVDKNFALAPLRAQDFQTLQAPLSLQPRDLNPRAPGFNWFHMRGIATVLPDGTRLRPLGSSGVLALAREAILQIAALAPAAGPRAMFASPGPSMLELIEDAIGARQVSVRQQLTATANAAACSGCVTLSPQFSTAAGVTSFFVTADVTTKVGDPFNTIAIGLGVPAAASVSGDATRTSIWGSTRASLAAIAVQTPAAVTLAANYEARRSNAVAYNGAHPHGVSVVLRSGTAAANFQYQHVFTGGLGTSSNGYFPGTTVTFGGQIGRLAERAWEFDASNWSIPRYDAFGLPRNWTPTADAALQGGAEGQPTEQFLLDRAASAADEATRAIQQAFENLQQQSNDVTALSAAEERAQELNRIELAGLCGEKDTCRPDTQYDTPEVAACTLAPPLDVYCQEVRTTLGNMVSAQNAASPRPIPLSEYVDDILQRPEPDFDEFRGGRIETLLIDQWTAWRQLETSLANTVKASELITARKIAAFAELQDAIAQYNLVDAEVIDAFNDLAAASEDFAQQRMEFQTNKATYDSELATAKQLMDFECSDYSFKAARDAGWSWSGDDIGVSGGGSIDGYDVTVEYNNKSWSDGAVIAQVARCKEATITYDNKKVAVAKQKKTIQAALDLIQPRIDALDLDHDKLNARRAAAEARREAAFAGIAMAVKEAESQLLTSYQTVQAQYGQVLHTVAALSQAFTQADLAKGRMALDLNQTSYDIRTRFGVRKRFTSYDLWRARALSENARRLAVAARRAIEARYVVDLSTLRAPEPFVDAPAVWADEIYDSDLKPPVALGLERSPTTASGIYPNKLVDYVSNLRLFLDGYTVQRPTAAVRADAEVVQLSGPAPAIIDGASGGGYAFIDPSSAGWQFYCARNKTWITHPDSALFFAGATPEWRLAKACPGATAALKEPPTRAKLAFVLDPWGRLQGSRTNEPFGDRHNVRANGLAVNLVGAGIRDCQQAPDPAVCYAEPFIRYSLQHVGPVLVTDHEQKWHSLDIPIAVIEGGKALATEEWLDPVTNSFNRSDVANVTRPELVGRPVGGAYELTLELTSDVRIERIERIQLLMQTEYWVSQH